jgi:adenylate cyclase
MAARLIDHLLGRHGHENLPDRVVQAIARQQLESEKLIAYAQLAVGLIWTALYLAAPKTFESGMTFEPVPIALGGYIAFTLVRLYLVRLDRAPGWLLALSVLVDMTLLMGLIWSFHLQYQQPASFYLKAPTLLYVFIFIALRALRFSAPYVLLAGAAAAVGWLGLLYYALSTSEAPNMGVTRDYISYMTSNMVLIGAEFDKVIAILMSTAILAAAIVRARRLLITAVVESAAHSDLSRFFSPEIAQQITAAENRIEPGEGEIRQVAVLFCDIRGFTPLAMTMAPNELMTCLADYEQRMVAVIQKHGGSIDKFLGDGIMATFGAAIPTECYAADALRAIEDLGTAAEVWRQQTIASGGVPLTVNFSVTAGPAVFGAIGDSSRLEFTVIGEAVNLAAKLEKANKTEGAAALTTEETLTLAKSQGYQPSSEIEIRRNRLVDGVETPLDLAVLLP